MTRRINQLTRKAYYLLSPSLRLLVRRLVFFPIDAYEYITGNKHPLQPPKGLIFTGRGDFIKTGKHFTELLKTHAGLTPNSSVLDIGCGIGRLAVALSDVLNEKGRYEGFDIVDTGINWCKKNIQKKFPNFNFTLIPAFNKLYNTNSIQHSANLKFPYPDNSFDIAVATSVFTHMLYEETNNYLSEIYRTLKPKGIAMITCFVLDENSRKHMNKSEINFPCNMGKYFVMDENVPEANVAYPEEELNHLFNMWKLKVLLHIPGRWSTAPEYSDSSEFQDTYFLQKIT